MRNSDLTSQNSFSVEFQSNNFISCRSAKTDLRNIQSKLPFLCSLLPSLPASPSLPVFAPSRLWCLLRPEEADLSSSPHRGTGGEGSEAEAEAGLGCNSLVSPLVSQSPSLQKRPLPSTCLAGAELTLCACALQETEPDTGAVERYQLHISNIKTSSCLI